MREPYTYKVISSPLIGWPTCHILFDETPVREIEMSIELVREFVSILNKAYVIGYTEGRAGF